MLNPKQQRFVAEYVKDLNATAAYKRAGYAAKGNSAEVNAGRLLRNAQVAAAIAEKTAKHLDSTDLTAARVLEELRRLAFSDLRGLFDAVGNLRPIHELSSEQAASIASLEVIKKNAEAGDGVVDTVHKLKVWDKVKALDILSKHFGLQKENVQHTGEIRLHWAS